MAIACCVTFPRFQCVALFPAKSMVSPRTLPFCVDCVTLFAIILFLVACFLFLLVFPVTLCLGTYLLDLLCLPWPTRWVQNCSFCFSCLSLPYVCLLVFLFLCHNSVGPAAGDMTGRTRIRRNLVPSGLGLRIFVYVSCLFSIFFRLRILLVSSGASHGYFLVLFGLPGIRDDIAQLV